MSGNSDEKITGPLADRLATDGNWSQAAVDRTDTIRIHVHVRAGEEERAMRDVEAAGGRIQANLGTELYVDIPAERVFDVADSRHVRLIDKVYEARELAIPDAQISEGLEVANVDQVQDAGLTGEGVTIAVIDTYFDVTNPKFGPDGRDQIVGQVGPSGSFYEGYSGLHGTGSTEVVSDMAPDADLLLVAFDTVDQFPSLMDNLRQNYDVDVATMSLGFPASTRIDGQDPHSEAIKDFTDQGKLFTAAAGNELWTSTTYGGNAASTPLVREPTASGDSTTRVCVGSTDGSVYAYDVADGSEEWTTSLDAAVRTDPAAVDGAVCVATEDGTLHLVDGRTGSLDRTGSHPTPAEVNAAPTVAGGTVYCHDRDGRLLAFDP